MRGKGRPSLVFMHGWGFDAGFWTPLRDRLNDYKTSAPDLGFYGKPKTNKTPDRPLIAIGHSLGFLWLLHKKPFAWDALIGINAFPRFTQAPDFPEGVPPHLLNAMAETFATSPHAALDDFSRLCGDKGNWAADGAPDLSMFAKGLEWLGRWDERAAFAAETAPVLLLAGRRDAVAPPALSKAMAALNPGTALKWKNGGGHLLALSDPQWCAHEIKGFLRERIA